MGESRHHAPVAAFSLPALVNLDTACTDIFLLGILRALASKTSAAERSYSARWRCAFGGSIPHTKRPRLAGAKGGAAGGGRANIRTFKEAFGGCSSPRKQPKESELKYRTLTELV